MPEPLQLPIRVLLKGPSNLTWLTPMGGPRSDFHLGRALEAELLGAGRPATVQTISVPSDLAKTALRKWESEVIGFSPDVIIMMYGYECVHLFLPRWLERHANSLKARPGLVREQYRKRVVRPAWKALGTLQARLDRSFVGAATKSIRPRRCVRDQERLIRQMQQVGSPLILVFEIVGPAKRYESWFPGMAARVAEYNRMAAEMVDRLGLPNVRYFRVAELIEQHAEGSLDVAIPDGFHFAPFMHRIFGAEVAHEILKWAETQEHLKSAG